MKNEGTREVMTAPGNGALCAKKLTTSLASAAPYTSSAQWWDHALLTGLTNSLTLVNAQMAGD